MKKNNRVLSIALGGLFALISIAKVDTTPYCQPQTASENAKKMPTLTLPAFKVQIQVTNLIKKYSIWTMEYYDDTKSKVSMHTVRDGNELVFFVNYKDKYTISYNTKNKACAIDKLNVNNNLNFFGSVSGGNFLHPFDTKHVFDLGQPDRFIYNGSTEVINGIKTDHWRACLSWPDYNDVFTVDYYFGQKIVKGITHQIPLRAEVFGEKSDPNSSPTQLQMIYEYLDFEPSAGLDVSVFDIPTSVPCADTYKLLTQSSKKLPPLPEHDVVSFEFEEIQESKNEVLQTKMLYDPIRKLVRTEVGGEVSIDDFNSGVHYAIVQDVYTTQVTCVTRKIYTNLDDAAKASENGGVEMKSFGEFMSVGTQGYYIFYGTTHYRGILVDIWKGAIFTVYYVSKNWAPANSTNKDDYQFPVAVLFQGSRINYLGYKLNPNYKSVNPFDVTQCKTKSEKKPFRLTLVPTNFERLLNDLVAEELIYSVHLKIQRVLADFLKISPVLIHWTDMFKDGLGGYEVFFWDGVLLAPAPQNGKKAACDLSTCWSTLSDLKNKEISISTNGRFVSDNASFTVTEIIELDSLYRAAVTTNSPLTHFEVYNNRFMSNDFEPDVKTTTPIADDCASLCLKKQTFECRAFRYCSATGQCSLIKTYPYIYDYNVEAPCDLYLRNYTVDFTPLTGFVLKPQAAELYEGIDTYDICAKMCLKIKRIPCESFDYCPISKECFLQKDRSYGDYFDAADNKPACKHFIRNYLSDYKATKKTTLISMSSDYLFRKGDFENPETCASYCSQGHFLDGCGQFDYCPSTKQCQFVSAVNSKYMKVISSDECTTYTMGASKMIAQRSHTASSQKSSSTATTYSGGSLVALSLSMGVTGIFVGCIVMFFVARRLGWTLRPFRPLRK